MADAKTILVVEDEYFLAESIKDRLEYLGYQVLLAEHGEAALELLKEKKCNLILLDIIMPVLDGWDTLKAIRQNSQLKNLPVIMVSARATDQDKEKSLAYGANDHLNKPFSWDDMAALIKKHL